MNIFQEKIKFLLVSFKVHTVYTFVKCSGQ